MAVKHAQSPLAPKTTQTLPRIAGVKLAAARSGVRYKDRDDVMLALLPAGATVAGVLTRSKCSSAPVDWCRKNLARGKVRASLVNAGNANAFTGKLGDKAVEESTRAVAQALGCPRNEVLMASTGVIGQPLDWEKIAAVVPAMIMIARGMATMLGFVFTDAKIPGGVLQKLLADAADKSLNCVTVDGDTSTSDTLLMVATGAARHAPIEEADDPVLVDFKRALDEVLIDLAQLLARDGEGATKFVTINVGGASSNGAARKIGLAVANSPLVKTAIAGEDANWGRIVMAVGKSGERADRDKLKISIGGVKITEGGQVVPNYDETPVAKHIKGTDVVIYIDLGIGRGRCRDRCRSPR